MRRCESGSRNRRAEDAPYLTRQWPHCCDGAEVPELLDHEAPEQRYGLGDRALDPVDPASDGARLNHDLPPRRVAARQRQTARPRALDDAHPRWPGCGSRLLVFLYAGADRGAVALAAGELEVVVADLVPAIVVHGLVGEGFSEDDLDHEITVVVHEDHVVCRR